MGYEIANRVFETSTTTGTSDFNLLGSVAGFQTFVAGVGDTSTCNYEINNGSDWEIGIGTIAAGSPDVLVRTTVLSSSNAGAKVNFGSGTKNVFLPFIAENTALEPKDNAFTGDNTFAGAHTVNGITYPTADGTIGQALVTDGAGTATFGDVTPDDASETVKGIVELATSAEVITGTDTERAVTPAGLQGKIDALPVPLTLNSSAPITWTANSTISWTHGLGSRVNVGFSSLTAICTVANNGYVVGDTLKVGDVDSGDGFTMVVNSDTELRARIDNIEYRDFVTNTRLVLSPTQFDLILNVIH